MNENFKLRSLAQILNTRVRIFEDISVYDVFSSATADKLAAQGFNAIDKLACLPVIILDNLLAPAEKDKFISYAVSVKENKPLKELFNIDPIYFKNTSINELKLNPRSFSRLNSAGINTISDLLNCAIKDFYSLNHLGVKSGEEIFNKAGFYFKRFKITPISVKWAQYEHLRDNERDGDLPGDNKTAVFNKADLNKERKLKDIFGVESLNFSNFSIGILNLSTRPSNCLNKNKITTIDALLNCTAGYLRSIKNMGEGSVNEILDKLKDFLSGIPKEPEQNETIRQEPKQAVVDGKFRAHVDELIIDPEYTPKDLTEEQFKLFENIKRAQAGLGYESTIAVHKEPEKYIGISKAFYELGKPYGEFLTFRRAIEDALLSVNPDVFEKSLYYFVQAYCLDKNAKPQRVAFKADAGLKVKSLIYLFDKEYGEASNKKVFSDNVLNFARWLAFDFDKNLLKFRQKISRKESGINRRDAEIFDLRIKGITLKEIGKLYDVTRERIRQIAEKTMKSLKNLYRSIKPDFILLIYALESKGAAVTRETAENYLSDLTDLIFYLIKDNKDSLNPAYRYSEDLKAVVINGGANFGRTQTKSSNISKILDKFISSLPEIIEADNLEKSIEELCERQEINESYAKSYIYAKYKKYGVMRCAREPSKRAMFDYILKNYYKNGFKIGDKKSADEIISLVYRVFGEDLPCKTLHSIDVVIQNVGVLNGRGFYIHPQELKIKPRIIDKVNEYIANSDRTLFTFNELFRKQRSLFEGTQIKDGNALHGALKYYGTPFYMNRDYISKTEGVTFEDELEKFARERRTFSKREVLRYFFGVAESQILQSLEKSNDIFFIEHGKYAYVPRVFDINGEDRAIFSDYLKRELSVKRRLNIETVYQELNALDPKFFERNRSCDRGALFAVLWYIFRDKYKFTRPYISLPDGV